MIKAFAHPALNHVFQMDNTECTAVFSNDQWRAATRRNPLDRFANLAWHLRAVLGKVLRDCVNGAFANASAIHFDPAHASGSRKWNEFGIRLCQLAPTQIVFLLCEDDDGTAFGSFISQR